MNRKMLATICRFCPMCVTARLFPKSSFAKKLAEMEKNCPCCRAYKELYGTERTS